MLQPYAKIVYIHLHSVPNKDNVSVIFQLFLLNKFAKISK